MALKKEDNKMNKVKMIVNKNKMTVKFECEGDIWKWLSKKANKNKKAASVILEKVRYNEEDNFYYETQMEKFIKRFTKSDLDVEIVTI